MAEDLRVMGRATQGVKLINIKSDKIAAVTKVMKNDVEETIVLKMEMLLSLNEYRKVKPVLRRCLR
jgi:DNA gyrase subunit A